jgi:hypothetical protein
MQSLSPIPILSQGVALQALGEWLMDQNYAQHSREAIVGYTALEGTPTGSVYLDREDEAAATEIFIEAMADVPIGSDLWDDETFCFDAEMLAEGNHPWPIPTVGDDDRSVPPDAALIPPELDADDAPYEPSAEDVAWLGEAEARWPAIVAPISGGSPEESLMDEQRDWYRRNPLAEFNAERPDSD